MIHSYFINVSTHIFIYFERNVFFSRKKASEYVEKNRFDSKHLHLREKFHEIWQTSQTAVNLRMKGGRENFTAPMGWWPDVRCLNLENFSFRTYHTTGLFRSPKGMMRKDHHILNEFSKTSDDELIYGKIREKLANPPFCFVSQSIDFISRYDCE